MKARQYSFLILTIILLFGAGFAGLNYVCNDFGLWRHRDTARIWELEKTSKYLLAHRYVPENFDGILIGASVSDNLDTRKLGAGKIYNLSMAGGNITEIGAAANIYIDHDSEARLMIVALHPYLTKNSGLKSFQIDPKEYEGSVFSLIPVTLWARKIQHALGLMHRAYDDSAAGWNNFTLRDKASDMEVLAGDLRQGRKEIAPLVIDQRAVAEMDALLNKARGRGIKVAAYYQPIFSPVFEIMDARGDWAQYQAAMAPLFRSGEIILDMNRSEFGALQDDPAAFHDLSHLSQAGADRVIDALNHALVK